jgi:hypothetical protein
MSELGVRLDREQNKTRFTRMDELIMDIERYDGLRNYNARRKPGIAILKVLYPLLEFFVLLFKAILLCAEKIILRLHRCNFRFEIFVTRLKFGDLVSKEGRLVPEHIGGSSLPDETVKQGK